MSFRLVVYGTASPAGSKRVVPAGGRPGGRPLVVDASRGAAAWKRTVAQEAGAAMQGRRLLEGPLAVTFTFVAARPKGHFGTRGLRPSAPSRPTTRPDVLKLARAVEDALTGIVWRDDAQIVDERLTKVYGEPARVEVEVAQLAAMTLEAA